MMSTVLQLDLGDYHYIVFICNAMIMDDYIKIICETITFPHHDHEQIV